MKLPSSYVTSDLLKRWQDQEFRSLKLSKREGNIPVFWFVWWILMKLDMSVVYSFIKHDGMYRENSVVINVLFHWEK